MRNRLLASVFLLFNAILLNAQTGPPTLVLSSNGTCGCDGCFFMTIANGQGIYAYTWSNGASGTIANNTATVCGFCPGSYTVTVTEVNGQGIVVDTGFIAPLYISINILSLDPSVCNLDSMPSSNTCDRVCAGTQASYTIQGLGNPFPSGSNVTWSVSGSSNWTVDPAPSNKLTVIWDTPGNGSVSAVAFGPNGCISEDATCVTVLEPPKAVIGSNPPQPASGNLQVCLGQTVDFHNLSTGDADFLEWLFSDDLSSTNINDPQHTFQTAGLHTVTLIASSSCLCADTTTVTIEVLDAVAPTLSCVATVCPGETVSYAASNACAPFSWAVSANGTVLQGGTAQSDSITVQWTNGPVGTITLGAASCSGATCPVNGVINIPVVSDNAEIKGKERVCPGSSEAYQIEPFGGCGFIWTLSGGGTIVEGQGTNRIRIDWNPYAPSNVTFWLSVKYDNCYLGCGGQDSIPVKVLPAFYLDGPVEACILDNGAFVTRLVSSNSLLNCNWHLTGPSGATVWNSPAAASNVTVPFTDGDGYYRLFAVPANINQTCTDQVDWAIQARPLPAKLSGIKGPVKICPGVTYTYEALGGTPESNYLWTVQNGPGATTSFPGKDLNVAWSASGPRWVAVAHVSNDGLGCKSDTIRLDVAPFGLPEITGTAQVCEDDSGNYFTEPLEKVDMTWQTVPADAGTVQSGQGSNAVQIFWTLPGNHTVSMNVCGLTATFPVTVLATPDPAVQAPAALCPGQQGLVQTAGVYTSYSWMDGAGTVLSTNASLMLGAGNYAVEVVDANGCRGVKEFYIDSWDAPDVSLTTPSPTGFCNNSLFVPMVALINTDANYTFQWYQDGVLIPGATGVNYSSNQYALYTVVATNSNGCTSEAGPIRLFEYCGNTGQCTGQNCPGSLCPPGTVDLAIDGTARCDSFQMHLLDPNGSYQHGSARWTVGISGGAVLGQSTDVNPSFVLDNAGEYVAILIVTLNDGNNCHVYDFFSSEAVAHFDYLAACPDLSTQFIDNSEFLPSGGITNYDWVFGDPTSGVDNQSAVRNPGHVYHSNGAYDVTLTVTGTSGCTSSATRTVDIPVLPTVAFAEPALKCAGNALEFLLPPNPADVIDMQWDFGDPASGALNDASDSPAYHLFSPAGAYTVTATATNVYGCTASFSRILNIVPNTLSGAISPPAPAPICEGSSITLSAPGTGLSYLWSDNNMTTTSFLTVNQEGSYQVTVTDANGCTYAPPPVNVEVKAAPDALIKALVFNELGQISGVSYPSYTVCEGEDVILQTVANSAVNYSWSVSNGNNQLLQYTDDRNNLLAVGNYTYKVTVTNPATGCSMVTEPFFVKVNPVPKGFSISGTGSCNDGSTVLQYTGPQPPNWQLVWNNGQSGPTLQPQEAGAYQIRVINEFGCEARSAEWVLLPGPPVLSLPSGCHTRCNPDTLCIPNLPTVTAWQWYQDGNPVPGATTANFIAQQSGTYWAQLTDIYGCTAQSGPLTLNLYTGYGNILGQVWSDVNNNGIIDAADTLVSGIPVILYQNSVQQGSANSGASGDFAFTNILSTNYSVELDVSNLPPVWNIVIGDDPVTLSGCDVQENADLLVHFQCLASSGTQSFHACPGGSATYNGVNVPVGTSQDFQLTNWLGCDSIVTVTVLTAPTSFEIIVLNACPGDSATFAGEHIPAGSFKEFKYANIYGCDSTLEVYVVPLQPSTGSETLYACPGSSATYAGVSIPAGATQAFTLQNWQGCDSVVTVKVQALAASSGTETLYACPGSSATYAGVSIPVGASQNFTLQNWLGCDSIVTVTVQQLPNSTGSATFLFACSGGFATYNGTNIPAGSSQQFTLQTWQGCDSIVTVSVAALPPATGTATLYACPGGSATYNGVSIPAGASQNFTLQNWLGCDSIVTVNVTPWTTSSGTASLFACPGGSATYQGVGVPVGTTQNFTLPNWLGCDSIVTVTVQAWPVSSGSLEAAVCPGETFVYQGVSLNGGATQNFTLPNWLGCDSVVTVTVKQLQASSGILDAQVCAGETFTFNGEALAGGTVRDFHLVNAAGCDSVLTVMVQELPAASFAVETERACANAATGSLQVQVNPGGQGPFRYSINQVDYQDATQFDDLTAGDYEVYLQDANNCVVSLRATIPAIPPIVVALPDGIIPCDSTAVTLTPVIAGGDTASLSLKWWNGSSDPTTVVTEPGPVWLEVSDICGMERTEAMVQWADVAQDPGIVYVPNVMKPTSLDPENARFRPLFASGIQLLGMKFMVFDRWGNKLFESINPEQAWDGIFQGSPMNPGVEVWYLEADVSICGRVLHVVKKGDVTVVR